MQSRHPNQPLHIILCHSSLILDICNDTQPTCVRRCMKTSGKTQKIVIVLSYERVVGWNEWGTTQLTKTPPHSPYSTPKVSVKFSLHPFLQAHSLFWRKRRKKRIFCVVKIELFIYIDYKFKVWQGKNDRMGTERQRTRGLRVQILEPFSRIAFFQTFPILGVMKKKTMS